MRKAVCGLLALALMLAAGAAAAGAAEHDSAAGLRISLDAMAQTDDSGTFDYEKSDALVADDGTVILYLESVHPWADYGALLPDMVTLVSDLWKLMGEVHAMYSQAPFAVEVWQGDNLLFQTDGTMVVDFAGTEHPMAFTPE